MAARPPRRPPGSVPEWLKGTGCKPVGYAYVGSNPTAPTGSADRVGRASPPSCGDRIRRLPPPRPVRRVGGPDASARCLALGVALALNVDEIALLVELEDVYRSGAGAVTVG